MGQKIKRAIGQEAIKTRETTKRKTAPRPEPEIRARTQPSKSKLPIRAKRKRPILLRRKS